MVTCNQMQLYCDSSDSREAEWSQQLSSRRKLMKGCLCCRNQQEQAPLLDNKQQQQHQHHESDLTFALTPSPATTTTTTMETDDSSEIMNQGCAQSEVSCSCSSSENSNLHPANESVNLLPTNDKRTNPTTGWASGERSPHRQPPAAHNRAILWSKGITCGPSHGNLCHLLQMCLVLAMSACLVQAGFWTFYFPNFLKASGYKELTEMIDKVEKQINSTKDAHADAMHFWDLMREEPSVGEDYYPEESVCEEVFPLFRDKAIEYADIDYKYYMKPLEAYRDHLLKSRDLWFPEGTKSKSILPREYEQGLYKKDLELKIEGFDSLANEPQLRQMREEMVNIWRNVKRSLDTSLPCLYLRYSYRHVAADINQFALDMNLRSLNEAMEMLESAYKRVALYKDQDRAAIEKINDDIEREQNLVMID